MAKEEIVVEGPLGPLGPYSSAIRADATSLVFVSGQVPRDEKTGKIETTDIAEQVKVAIRNGFSVLAHAGCEPSDVVKVTLFLTDMSSPQEINAAYAECFSAPYPARTMVEVSRLPQGALAEVELLAVSRR